jgi:DNA-binding CsgD family transcriptional regulator
MRSPTGTASPGHPASPTSRERSGPGTRGGPQRQRFGGRAPPRRPRTRQLSNGRGSEPARTAHLPRAAPLHPARLARTRRDDRPQHPVVIGLPIKPRGRVLLTAARAGRQLTVIVEAEPQPIEHRRIGRLTRRERDVVELLLQGIPTKRIVLLLNISPWTVRDHLRSTFAKTGVENRNELMALLLSPPKAAA